MCHAWFGLGHAAKYVFPCLGLHAPLAPGLALASCAREIWAHVRIRLAGFAGKLDQGGYFALVPDAMIRT